MNVRAWIKEPGSQILLKYTQNDINIRRGGVVIFDYYSC